VDPGGALRWGAITDVPGVLVGHATRAGGGWLTGVTVVLPPPGSVGAVDVRGGGPGTHETDALDPTALVPTVDAVVLTGGSAYGLSSAGGVQAWCEEQRRGFAVGPPEDRAAVVVPIVPAAAVFDLGRGGDARARPDAALGRHAVEAAAKARPDRPPERGCVGAGTGAVAAFGRLKGGVGTASLGVPGVEGLVVGALAVVNAVGSPADPVTGALLGTAFVPPGLPRPPAPDPDAAARVARLLAPPAYGGSSEDRRPPVMAPTGAPPANTTLAVVATNGRLDPAQARRTATAAHTGLARALDPASTLADGDTVFVLATGKVPVPAEAVPFLQALAATSVTLAILDGVLSATATRTPAIDVPAYRDLVG
jgi:L-aminopeptidase/D-esterase-like protein